MKFNKAAVNKALAELSLVVALEDVKEPTHFEKTAKIQEPAIIQPPKK